MIDNNLMEIATDNFFAVYQNFLVSKVYGSKNMFKKQFSDPETKELFDEIVKTYFNMISMFYEKNPKGTFDEEYAFIEKNNELKNLVNKYVEKTNDTTFYNFLKCYAYSCEQFDGMIYDEYNNISKTKQKKVINNIHNISINMYTCVENDIRAGNYWWLYDTATTLRRQLSQKLILIDDDRIQRMMDKYFDRKVEFDEFIKNQNLVKELDETMYLKKHARPYYFWWSTIPTGEKKLMMSPNPPAVGVYTFVSYQSYTQKEADTKEHNL